MFRIHGVFVAFTPVLWACDSRLSDISTSERCRGDGDAVGAEEVVSFGFSALDVVTEMSANPIYVTWVGPDHRPSSGALLTQTTELEVTAVLDPDETIETLNPEDLDDSDQCPMRSFLRVPIVLTLTEPGGLLTMSGPELIAADSLDSVQWAIEPWDEGTGLAGTPSPAFRDAVLEDLDIAGPVDIRAGLWDGELNLSATDDTTVFGLHRGEWSTSPRPASR